VTPIFKKDEDSRMEFQKEILRRCIIKSHFKKWEINIPV
jgi:hypothetical protein